MGTDYRATSGTRTFIPGEVAKNITVWVLGDAIAEPNEYFKLKLSNAQGAAFDDSLGVGTILNDDFAKLNILSLENIPEGSQGDSTTVVFTVTLSIASSETVTVDYCFEDSTATLGEDYFAVDGTLTFNPGPGIKERQIPVQILGDDIAEMTEVFKLTLKNAVGATINSQATGRIIDDDDPTSVPEDLPTITAMQPLAPNPARSSTQVSFQLAQAGPVQLTIYSADGRRVRTLATGDHPRGIYRIPWDGRDDQGRAVGSGVYYTLLATSEKRITRKLVLLR
jgi:hypothetical protein